MLFSADAWPGLADGSITLQGASLTKHIPGATVPSQDVYAITGGTGAYQGARGSVVSVNSTTDDSSQDTVTLLP